MPHDGKPWQNVGLKWLPGPGHTYKSRQPLPAHFQPDQGKQPEGLAFLQLKIMAEDVRLLVDGGCVMEVPRDEQGPLLLPYSQATSWAATITADEEDLKKKKSQPNFERRFWERPAPRRDSWIYRIPAHLQPGMAVEFGTNPRRRPNESDPEMERVDGGEGFVAVSIPATSGKRRWYGAVKDLDVNSQGSGALILVPLSDARKALVAAPAFSLTALSLPKLRPFIDAIRSGDLFSALTFADWLDEMSDPRGALIRNGIQELVTDLFPECS